MMAYDDGGRRRGDDPTGNNPTKASCAKWTNGAARTGPGRPASLFDATAEWCDGGELAIAAYHDGADRGLSDRALVVRRVARAPADDAAVDFRDRHRVLEWTVGQPFLPFPQAERLQPECRRRMRHVRVVDVIDRRRIVARRQTNRQSLHSLSTLRRTGFAHAGMIAPAELCGVPTAVTLQA